VKNDTSPEIDDLYYSLMMKKTPQERLKDALSMFDMAQKIVLASLNVNDNPRKELFLRFYENDFDSKTKDKILKYLISK
jgi:hypothetical protein